jgi:hypothetical protein
MNGLADGQRTVPPVPSETRAACGATTSGLRETSIIRSRRRRKKLLDASCWFRILEHLEAQ